MSAPAPSTIDGHSLAALLDDLAVVTPGISCYCSGGDWAIGAQVALHPGRSVVLARSDSHAFVGAIEGAGTARPYLNSLESTWGFASPLLGPSIESAATVAASALMSTRRQWAVAIIAGLSSAHADALIPVLDSRFRCSRRRGLSSAVTSLEGGYEGFLSRRSGKMLVNLRRDRRRMAADGIELEFVANDGDPASVLARAQAVERASWKGGQGPSMLGERTYLDFYGVILKRAASQGRLRAAFATREGQDLAFIFGAVLGKTYRGFQLAFREETAPLGLGNQLQMALIERLAGEGVTEYDLGMDMPYKRRWCDHLLSLELLVIHR